MFVFFENEVLDKERVSKKLDKLPGGGISKSCVWGTLDLPGRGSNAGMSAENCLLRTYSSSQVFRLSPRISNSSSLK